MSTQVLELIMCIIIYLIVFCFGMIIGSFLNVCIYRLPKNESLIKRSSHCMTCGEKIRARDLVPIFSWLFLKGKCHSCGEKISGRYPLVESLNALLYVWVFMQVDIAELVFDYASLANCIILCLYMSVLIVIAFIDYDTQEMHLSVLIAAALLAIPSFFLTGEYGASLKERIIGALIISVPFLILGLITGGMGMGDVVLMAAGGLLLGTKAIVVAALIGIVLAAIVGVIIKKKSGESKMAFGPYLCIGLAIAATHGTKIADWYINTFLTFE